jgi:hypothetical protein
MATNATGCAEFVEFFPFAASKPGTKALVIWVISGAMAVLGEPFFLMTAGYNFDPFIRAHGGKVLPRFRKSW